MKKVDDPTRRSGYEYVNAMSDAQCAVADRLESEMVNEQQSTQRGEATVFDGTTGQQRLPQWENGDGCGKHITSNGPSWGMLSGISGD